MARKKIASAAPTSPSTPLPSPENKVQTTAPVAAPAPTVPKQYYYRIRKITGFLSEILEVEVDETSLPPRMIGKQDSAQFLMGRVEDLVLGKGKR